MAGVSAGWQAYQGGGGAAGVARAFAGGVGGTAGLAIGGAATGVLAVGAVVAGFAELVVQMKAFSEHVVASNAHLSRWNGAIGTAYMMLNLHDFHRQVAYGRATQGTAITAVRAVDQMRDDWQGVNVLTGNVTNRAGGFAASFAGGVGADLSRIANRANVQLNQVDPNGLVSAGAGAGLWAGIKGMAGGAYDSFMNNPVASILIPGYSFWNSLTAGQNAAAKAANATVVRLAAGKLDDNFWGAMINNWAKAGPMLPRRSPRP